MSSGDQPVAKRLKTDKESALHDSTSSPAFGLGFDALTIVMSFLAPRELLRLSGTCKYLWKEVTATMVVKSAMINGGHAKRTIEELQTLMKNKSIYVPSPHRLLRLVNGKMCEACYLEKVNFVRPGTGLFLCWNCLTERYSRGWKTTWVRYRRNEAGYKPILFHQRVAGSTCGLKKFLLTGHFHDTSVTTVGPIVRFDDIDHIVDHTPGFDDYLIRILNAPGGQEYKEFTQAFEECKERSQREEKERYAKKREASLQNKKRKLEKAYQLVNDLRGLLAEAWRGAATIVHQVVPGKRHGPLRFNVPAVDHLMQPYILAPSKMKRKTLKEIANKIDTKFQLIADKSFLLYGFLSDDDPFESKLKKCVAVDLPSIHSLVYTLKLSDEWFALLEENRFLDALASFYGHDFAFLLLPPEQWGPYKEFKKPRPTGRFAGFAPPIPDASLFSLAQNVYKEKLDECRTLPLAVQIVKCTSDSPIEVSENKSVYGAAFRMSEAPFQSARTAIGEYKTWLLKRYIAEDGPGGIKERSKREFRLDDAWKNKTCLSFLLKRDFEGLDRLQEGGFISFWDRSVALMHVFL